MKATQTKILDVWIIPRVFGGECDFFFEGFKEKAFNEATDNALEFVQNNHSKLAKGPLRRLHYKLTAKAHGKFACMVEDGVFDVAVDIRQGSSTYGRFVGEILLIENKRSSHGFHRALPISYSSCQMQQSSSTNPPTAGYQNMSGHILERCHTQDRLASKQDYIYVG